jgi:hypothetical protein
MTWHSIAEKDWLERGESLKLLELVAWFFFELYLKENKTIFVSEFVTERRGKDLTNLHQTEVKFDNMNVGEVLVC